MDRLLDVKDLRTSFFTYAGEVKAVDGISFHVDSGEAVAIVGESGCGKSITAMSIMGLILPPGRIVSGSIIFGGKDLVEMSEKDLQKVRGNEIGLIFQDPMTSLNPTLTVKYQLTESLKLHQKMSNSAARARAIELLTLVGIPSPESRLNQYPHQFSGGMRQRVMIAMALACDPKLLIADEPTTALDVTIQAQIIELMKDLKAKLNTSVILITHDLGVVAGLCQRVIVMYAGKIIETADIDELFTNPCHPYTLGLLQSVPDLDQDDKKKLVPIEGQPPDLISPPKGCHFWPRCSKAMRICCEQEPQTTEIAEGHLTACWLHHAGIKGVVNCG